MATKAGINHIEFWVSDLERSQAFYAALFRAVGWQQKSDTEFSSGSTTVYFYEKPVKRVDGVGPRHICFQAVSRAVVDDVATLLKKNAADIIRGAIDGRRARQPPPSARLASTYSWEAAGRQLLGLL